MSMSAKRVGAITVTSIAIGLGSLAFSSPAIRGVGVLVGFSTLSAVFLFGWSPMASRRLSIAFGLYMLVSAIKFGMDASDYPQSRTFRSASTACFLLAVAWFIVETLLVRRRARKT